MPDETSGTLTPSGAEFKVALPSGGEFVATTSTDMLLARLLSTSEEQAKTLNRLHGTMEDMRKEQAQFNVHLATQREKVVQLAADRDNIHKTLYGPDGTGGLVKTSTNVRLIVTGFLVIPSTLMVMYHLLNMNQQENQLMYLLIYINQLSQWNQ